MNWTKRQHSVPLWTITHAAAFYLLARSHPASGA
jgi:hypothetical protein